MATFPFYEQRDQLDCGPTCLRMVTKYFGRSYSIQSLRSLCQITRGGVTLLDISEAAEKIGLRTLGIKLNVSQLAQIELPCILHWRENHFVVLYKIKGSVYYIADPGTGLIALKERDFIASWTSSSEFNNGIALVLKTTPRYYEEEDEEPPQLSWQFITRYLFTYRRLLIQLVLALAMGTLIQFATPILTQSIVDIGINKRSLSFINIILLAQLMLFIGSTSVDFMRSWILLHVSTRVNVSILTDLIIKLMRLPMDFFSTKTPGDLIQRINDEKRIETFLTGSTLSIIFSFISFVAFSVLIASYDLSIFSVFAVSTALYSAWIVLFLKKRRELDYKQFSNNTKNQDNIIELTTGMQEIKLNNAELKKRWKWEHIQARLFRYNAKSLQLNQYQQAGAVFIIQGRNILITWLSAKAVVNGQITLGTMMAIQFMIGQLTAPVEQLLAFIKSYQDAKISIDRLNEIHQLPDEEPEERSYINALPDDRSISIRGLTFRYPGAGNEPVLHNIDLCIPYGKTTAIVGMSGSGKTTILKLLLRFYSPEKGEIRVGNFRLGDIRQRLWRERCSAVMQDGYLFPDTIANNIALSDEEPQPEKLNAAVRIANIQDIVESFHMGLNERIGAGGAGLSQGQKQRILIARAVYKNPDFIFFDEATNSLDANNEKTIIENLNSFFRGRTVVVVAHRLSTVRNADNIVVLHKGMIIEQGNHKTLTDRKGEYYNLIRNQLELGM